MKLGGQKYISEDFKVRLNVSEFEKDRIYIKREKASVCLNDSFRWLPAEVQNRSNDA